MDRLAETVKQVVFSYAGGSPIVRTCPLSNEEQRVYAVTIIDWPEKHRPAGVMVQARVEGKMVIIEEDLTDKPLVDALVRAGIPREQIVMSYLEEQTATADS